MCNLESDRVSVFEFEIIGVEIVQRDVRQLELRLTTCDKDTNNGHEDIRVRFN